MSKELGRAVVFRNYAEELRITALGMQGEDFLTLLAIADSYEEMAASLEAIHRSKMAVRRSHTDLMTQPESVEAL